MNFQKQMMSMIQNSFDNMFNVPMNNRVPVPEFDPNKMKEMMGKVDDSYLERMKKQAKQMGMSDEVINAGIAQLKNFSDRYGICLLLVHHTRKQNSGDKFDMISGTNGLLGAADGAFLLQKEKRTAKTATLDISGRDQQDQRLFLVRNEERLVWELERVETELWKEKPDPLLELIAEKFTEEKPMWDGIISDFRDFIETDITPIQLGMKLNVTAGRLLNEYNILYESRRTHAGRRIKFVLQA